MSHCDFKSLSPSLTLKSYLSLDFARKFCCTSNIQCIPFIHQASELAGLMSEDVCCVRVVTFPSLASSLSLKCIFGLGLANLLLSWHESLAIGLHLRHKCSHSRGRSVSFRRRRICSTTLLFSLKPLFVVPPFPAMKYSNFYIPYRSKFPGCVYRIPVV